MDDELIEIVDSEGSVMSVRPRSEVHKNPHLLHKVVHVLVFNDSRQMLLQKRSMSKDIEPGKWDTSVGGHVSPGEDLRSAASREMKEELGIDMADMAPLYSYVYTDTNESEMVFTYKVIHNGPFSPNRQEIDEVAFWDLKEIRQFLGSGNFSGHFECEINKYLSFNPNAL
ncbi:MAG TPA: NUDIX domain-containing protein [Dissulfurispiraceae bacterium]|nr:NUDIX domain-containing protein [Dissulfurispiraceae bacterium]